MEDGVRPCTLKIFIRDRAEHAWKNTVALMQEIDDGSDIIS